jgi:hypothetical protein
MGKIENYENFIHKSYRYMYGSVNFNTLSIN